MPIKPSERLNDFIQRAEWLLEEVNKYKKERQVEKNEIIKIIDTYLQAAKSASSNQEYNPKILDSEWRLYKEIQDKYTELQDKGSKELSHCIINGLRQFWRITSEDLQTATRGIKTLLEMERIFGANSTQINDATALVAIAEKIHRIRHPEDDAIQAMEDYPVKRMMAITFTENKILNHIKDILQKALIADLRKLKYDDNNMYQDLPTKDTIDEKKQQIQQVAEKYREINKILEYAKDKNKKFIREIYNVINQKKSLGEQIEVIKEKTDKLAQERSQEIERFKTKGGKFGACLDKLDKNVTEYSLPISLSQAAISEKDTTSVELTQRQ